MTLAQSAVASLFKQGAKAFLVVIAVLVANLVWQLFFISQASAMFATYIPIPQAVFVCVLCLLWLSAMAKPGSKLAKYLPLRARHYNIYQATIVSGLVAHLALNSPFPDPLTTYSYIALFATRPLLTGYHGLTTKKAK